MRPGRRLAVAAGLVTLVLFVGQPNFRHPGPTRRLSDAAADASDACEYCGISFGHYRGRVQPARAALSVAVRAAVTMATRRSTISLLGS